MEMERQTQRSPNGSASLPLMPNGWCTTIINTMAVSPAGRGREESSGYICRPQDLPSQSKSLRFCIRTGLRQVSAFMNLASM